jgi:YVTN family beta-propeller protein
VTFTPDSAHAYVTTIGSLVVIDTTTHETTRIITGDLPRGVQFSPDGKRAYVANFGDRSVSVVDTITNSVTTTLAVGGYPDAVAISPTGDRVYVADYWSGALTAIAVLPTQDQHASTTALPFAA